MRPEVVRQAALQRYAAGHVLQLRVAQAAGRAQHRRAGGRQRRARGRAGARAVVQHKHLVAPARGQQAADGLPEQAGVLARVEHEHGAGLEARGGAMAPLERAIRAAVRTPGHDKEQQHRGECCKYQAGPDAVL